VTLNQLLFYSLPIRGTHMSASTSFNPPYRHPEPHFLCSPFPSSTTQGGETEANRCRPPWRGRRHPPRRLWGGSSAVSESPAAGGRADLWCAGKRSSGARADLRHRPQELPTEAAGASGQRFAPSSWRRSSFDAATRSATRQLRYSIAPQLIPTFLECLIC
jgi:hypothetical protein